MESTRAGPHGAFRRNYRAEGCISFDLFNELRYHSSASLAFRVVFSETFNCCDFLKVWCSHCRFEQKKGATRNRNPLISLEPGIGLEPTTCWLRISCSTNWAIPAQGLFYQKGPSYVGDYAHFSSIFPPVSLTRRCPTDTMDIGQPMPSSLFQTRIWSARKILTVRLTFDNLWKIIWFSYISISIT